MSTAYEPLPTAHSTFAPTSSSSSSSSLPDQQPRSSTSGMETGRRDPDLPTARGSYLTELTDLSRLGPSLTTSSSPPMAYNNRTHIHEMNSHACSSSDDFGGNQNKNILLNTTAIDQMAALDILAMSNSYEAVRDWGHNSEGGDSFSQYENMPHFYSHSIDSK